MSEHLEPDVELIADWLKAISAETRYTGLAQALLNVATKLPCVERAVTVLSEQGELFEAANAGFPRALAEVILTVPAKAPFKIPTDLMEQALTDRRAICLVQPNTPSAFDNFRNNPVKALCVPLVQKRHAVGVLYLEAPLDSAAFTPSCIAVATLLASQAAVSFENARLIGALRETHKWMTTGQQVGRMGSYRFNSRTRDSRGSKEVYDVVGLDYAIKPISFEAYLACIHPDDRPNLEVAVEASMEALTPFRHEYRVVHPDGSIVEISAVGEWDENDAGELELEGILTDVTEAKATQRRLAEIDTLLEQANGLANLGEIAGSIIHEINQPLTAIIAGAEASIRWLNRDKPDLDEAKASISRTIENGRRAAEVVQSLKALAKRSKAHFGEIEIDATVREAILLAKPEIERSGVILRMRLHAPATVISGDKVQLQQVVLNLVRNAADAMREVRGAPRVLTVESRIEENDVVIALHDTGPGIQPDNRERLFEALYTTKAGGLGLGLAICRKIVAAHDGKIWVEPNLPAGTTFRFALPLRRK